MAQTREQLIEELAAARRQLEDERLRAIGLENDLEEARADALEATRMIEHYQAHSIAWSQAHRQLVDAVTNGVLAKQVADAVGQWRQPAPVVRPAIAASKIQAVLQETIGVMAYAHNGTNALIPVLREIGVEVLDNLFEEAK